jgi:hypothetical protein
MIFKQEPLSTWPAVVHSALHTLCAAVRTRFVTRSWHSTPWAASRSVCSPPAPCRWPTRQVRRSVTLRGNTAPFAAQPLAPKQLHAARCIDQTSFHQLLHVPAPSLMHQGYRSPPWPIPLPQGSPLVLGSRKHSPSANTSDDP